MVRLFLLALVSMTLYGKEMWMFKPINRCNEINPILSPNADSQFFCPILGENVPWEMGSTFNPTAVVRDNKVYLLYRAEDSTGLGVGKYTSRIGLAVSDDGLHFSRLRDPVLFPQYDEQLEYEFPGGCEDPRVVEREDGSYILTYTQWNQEVYSLAVATSTTLMSWEKHGFAFKNHMERFGSKAGAIVCEKRQGRLIAARVNDKYWMYWGDQDIYLASSDDCVNWDPLLDDEGKPVPVLQRRGQYFDSRLIEPGPSPLLTSKGIVLIYNARNCSENGDVTMPPHTYSVGQALFDRLDSSQVINRSDKCCFKPKMPYEISGQYSAGTVFIEGMVFFKKQWFLYYGTADSCIGVAVSPKKFL
jgi:beta-1,2-mannosidase